METLLLTGKAMDFASRLKGHQRLVPLTHDLVHRYAKHAGLGGLGASRFEISGMLVRESYRPMAELLQERLSIHRQLDEIGWRGTPPDMPDPAVVRRRWQDAVTAQATVSGQSRAVAERVVVSMLNQLMTLAREAPWWEAHAEAVIAETVEWASGNLAVDSAPAQRAWDAYRSARDSLVQHLSTPEPGPLPDEEVAALPDIARAAEEEWRPAWDLWYATRSGG